MSMKKIVYTLVVMALSQTVFAQKDSTQTNVLNDVVVTANKFEQKQQETGKVLTVITQDVLLRNSGRQLTEVLNEQTGIVINGANNNLGTNQTISIRGSSGANTLILVDGVPAYDPSGVTSGFDINYININQVERIEILKGAQSTLYGSDAVAGVINIITKKKGTKPVNGYASLSAGSYGTINTAAGINGNSKGWQYNAGYTYKHSKGFSSAYDSTGSAGFDNDAYTQQSLNASVGYDAGKGFNMRAYTLVSQYKAGADEGAFTDDKDYNLNNKDFQLGTTAGYKFGKSKLVFNYQYNKVNRSLVDDSTDVSGFAKYQEAHYIGYSHFAELYGNFYLSPKAELVAGADYRHSASNQSYLSISSFGPYTSALPDSDKTSQGAAYASLILHDLAGFGLEVGGRLNNHSLYGWNGTYSLNPYYQIDGHWKLYANISSGYRVPSLYQLYDAYDGNKNLKPEQSPSYEGGAAFISKTFSARLTVFERDINNVIYYYTDPQTYVSSYLNADRQRDNGFEAELDAKLSKEISVSANYTYTDGTIHTASDFTGKDTSVYNHYRVPRNVFNLQLNAQPVTGFYLGLHLKAISNHDEPVYMGYPIVVKGYYTIDFHAEYAVVKQVKLFADFMNITDQKYFDVLGYNSKRFNFMAGARISF